MKFILVPKAREGLVGVADLPGDIDTVINTYSKLFPSGLDDSLVPGGFTKTSDGWCGDNEEDFLPESRKRWYFDGLTSSAKKEIEVRFNETGNLTDSVAKVIVDRVTNEKDAIEMPVNLMKRVTELKDYIKQVSRQYKGQKIALVTHSILLQAATSPPNKPTPTYDPKTMWITFPKGSIYVKNSEFLPLDKYINN